ncbi:MAG: flagellar hook-basal body complex protein FliE [Acidiphilium sp.]|nr:flagellar hook-basal body complex protein FliE [Acidiphilium sp.]MDD4936095.1 flagellar hook-basal body complex protein FliE [Acidiphilium sp.]
MSGSISTILNAVSGTAAYQRTAQTPGGVGEDFTNYLSNMVTDTVKQSASTESIAQNGLMGNGNLTQVVTSVAQAQLALQTTVAIRDKLIQAYQSIMSMPI